MKKDDKNDFKKFAKTRKIYKKVIYFEFIY